MGILSLYFLRHTTHKTDNFGYFGLLIDPRKLDSDINRRDVPFSGNETMTQQRFIDSDIAYFCEPFIR